MSRLGLAEHSRREMAGQDGDTDYPTCVSFKISGATFQK